MMWDRYLFKAKRLDNGEWVIGNLIRNSDAEDGWEAIIIPVKNSNMFTKHIGHGYGSLGFENWYRVDPSTICQCTGLKDKNGNLIWENDIVSFSHTQYTRNYAIEFENTFCNYGLRFRNKSIHFRCKQSTLCMYDCEVLGNVFDNPELLEV